MEDNAASDGCRCQIVGWSRDPYEPHVPAQPEWEQADDCPVHPLAARASNWFREELRRAKARLDQIPSNARPRFNLRPTPEPRGCHCGHPGAGCTCVNQ